jgi:hypothetical protein
VDNFRVADIYISHHYCPANAQRAGGN